MFHIKHYQDHEGNGAVWHGEMSTGLRQVLNFRLSFDTGCLLLDKQIKLSNTQFPHLENEDTEAEYFHTIDSLKTKINLSLDVRNICETANTSVVPRLSCSSCPLPEI